MERMPNWLRRTIAILSLGGGTIGLVACLGALFQNSNVFTWMILIGFILMYAFGIFAGVLLLERAEGASQAAKVYWWLQVPVLSSSALSYMFTSGFHFTPWYGWVQNKFGANFLLGSYCNFTVGQGSQEAHVGVNLFAVLVVFLLARYSTRVSRRNPAILAEQLVD